MVGTVAKTLRSEGGFHCVVATRGRSVEDTCDVSIDDVGGLVHIRFQVPGRRVSPVVVTLNREMARSLAEELLDMEVRSEKAQMG